MLLHVTLRHGFRPASAANDGAAHIACLYKHVVRSTSGSISMYRVKVANWQGILIVVSIFFSIIPRLSQYKHICPTILQ